MSSPLRTVILLAFKLGCIAFGGPAAHIAMLRQEVVERRGWMEDQRFLDLLGITNLIPGPNSTEMVMHIGQERGGWRGLVGAGIAFILPAASITLVFAWLYGTYGTTTEGEWLLRGIKPVVLAVVLQAVWNLGRTAIKDVLLAVVGAAVFVLYLLGMNELVLLFGGAILAAVARWLANARSRPGPGTAHPGLVGILAAGTTGLATVADPAVAYSGLRLFLTFLKIGGLLYGSGYVLVAFLRNDLVERLGWITERQLLDAIAVGQFTPGPVFTTATFVGYLAGGFSGAILATIAIFLPAFVFVAIVHPLLDRLTHLPWVRPILDGINVAAIGLMAAVAVILSRDAIVDPLTGILAVVALVLLVRFKVNSALLILAGAAISILLSLAG
ncbi:MAG: chromate efflux transporter [Chloroflexota bacterium]|nr:chromate efflux transporter [Chloroflexota bacterium]